jgi:hypothetical protein
VTTLAKRATRLNESDGRDSEYAFYWIPQSQPARQNPVLDVSIREVDAIKRFVVSCFGLTAVLLEVE